MEIVDPSAKNGFTRRSVSTPTTWEVFTEPSGFPVMLPNPTPLAKSGSVTDFFLFSARVTARSLIPRISEVISWRASPEGRDQTGAERRGYRAELQRSPPLRQTPAGVHGRLRSC